jgi:hypothetical protein
MNDTTTTLRSVTGITTAEIVSIIDNLREAARYARTQPVEAVQLTELALYHFFSRRWPEDLYGTGIYTT